MSCRAGSCGFAFPAFSRIGDGSNCCPSVSGCCKTGHSNTRRRLEAATQTRLGFAHIAAALWCPLRNSRLNRSAGDLSGRISLTLHSRHSGANLRRAPARAFHVCADRRERPRGHPPVQPKRAPYNPPTPLIHPLWPQESQLSPRTTSKPPVPEDSKSIQYP